MPSGTPLQRRDKSLFAFLMLTDARDGAVASLRLKHIDLVENCVNQDARDVNTKFAKTFTTWFFRSMRPTCKPSAIGWYTSDKRKFSARITLCFPSQEWG